MEDTLGVRSGERQTLEGALDWYRAVVPHKIDGLGPEAVRRVMTATGLSLLGVIKHLAWVERGWFQDVFAGHDVESIDSDDDNSVEFLLRPEEAADSIVRFYLDQVDRSRAIAADASLDELSARATGLGGQVSLRWILVHMIEETARHAGHMDLMREAIDGRTGD